MGWFDEIYREALAEPLDNGRTQAKRPGLFSELYDEVQREGLSPRLRPQAPARPGSTFEDDTRVFRATLGSRNERAALERTKLSKTVPQIVAGAVESVPFYLSGAARGVEFLARSAAGMAKAGLGNVGGARAAVLDAAVKARDNPVVSRAEEAAHGAINKTFGEPGEGDEGLRVAGGLLAGAGSLARSIGKSAQRRAARLAAQEAQRAATETQKVASRKAAVALGEDLRGVLKRAPERPNLEVVEGFKPKTKVTQAEIDPNYLPTAREVGLKRGERLLLGNAAAADGPTGRTVLARGTPALAGDARDAGGSVGVAGVGAGRAGPGRKAGAAQLARPAVSFREVDPEKFEVAVDRFVKARPDEAGFLTVRSAEQMRKEGMRTFLSKDGKVGFAVEPSTGDIRNVFNLGGPKGAGAAAVIEAQSKYGGRILDAYDTRLTDIYRDLGFKETARFPWDEGYRPPTWNEAKYGKPDVVGMRYEGPVGGVDELWEAYTQRRGVRLGGSEAGVASPTTLARIAGAGVGATLGATSADHEDGLQQAGRALVGAAAGSLAPSLLRRTGKLTAAERAYQNLFDEVYSLRKFGRQVGGSDALSHAASTAKGHIAYADELLGLRGRASGVFRSTPTLRRALESAKGIEDDVTKVAQAQRAIELDDAGMGWKLGGLDRAGAEALVASYAGNAPVQKAIQDLRDYYAHLLELKHKAGLLTPEEFKAIKESGEFYVPLVRDFEKEGLFFGAGGRGQLQSGQATRRMFAGEASSDIVDPYLQAVKDTHVTARAVLRQRVNQTLGRIVEANPRESSTWLRDLGTDLEAIPTRTKAEGRLVSATLDGRRHYYEVTDPGLLEAVAYVPPHLDGALMKVLRTAKNVFRTGVTILPGFTVSNATRDAFFTSTAYRLPVGAAAAGSTAGAVLGGLTAEDGEVARGVARGWALGLGAGVMGVHAKRVLGAMGHILGHSEDYQHFLRNGGGGSGMYIRNTHDAEKALALLKKKGVGAQDIIFPRNPIEALKILNQAVEEAPRLARFREAKAAGSDLMSAAALGRDVSVDFSRAGNDPLVRLAKSTTAFWNPKIQGLDRVRRALFSEGGRSARAWAVGVATMTLPSLALLDINKDDESYWNRPVWERNIFWLVPVGKKEGGETRFLRIPKPFEPGAVFASLPERLVEYHYQRDPEKTAAALKALLSNTTEGALPVPTLLRAPVEASIGKQGFDTFRGKPIVGAALAREPVGEQYTADTPTAALAIGRAINVSPEKVRHVLRGAFGPAGELVSEYLVDPAARAAGLDPRPPKPKRDILERTRFLTRSTGFSSDNADAMFRKLERGEPHAVELRRLVESGERETARTYANKHRTELLDYLSVVDAVSDFRALASVRRKVEASRNISPERKRQLLDRLSAAAARVTSTTPP